MKCKLISSIGSTCAYPPPAAPPFIPNTGPNDGSLITTVALTPILLSPSVSPIEVVVFPSPAGVGVMAVTRTSFFPLALLSSISFNGSFAILFP